MAHRFHGAAHACPKDGVAQRSSFLKNLGRGVWRLVRGAYGRARCLVETEITPHCHAIPTAVCLSVAWMLLLWMVSGRFYG